MKTQVRILYGTLIIALLTITTAIAQPPHAKAKGNKNGKVKGGPPPWAPAHGYRAKMQQQQQCRHVYYPEQDVYYDTQKEVYIYVGIGGWEVSARLPVPLRNQNLESSRQVFLDIEAEWPQRYNKEHRYQYASIRSDRSAP